MPANLAFSSLVRHIADEILINAKFSKTWCSRLKLVVDELFMNAVKYGSTKDTSMVYIVFSFSDTEIGFTIEDDGTGKNKVTPEDLEKIIATNRENNDLTRTSGRGLSMITGQWTDSMTVKKSEHGGMAVSFTKKIESAEAVPAEPSALLKGMMAKAATSSVMESSTSVPKKDSAEVLPQGPVTEVKLSGEIDQSNIDDICAPVTDQAHALPEGSTLLLDFSEVSYINSTFIGHLASWYTTMLTKKGTVKLKNVNSQIQEILELVGLLEIIELNSTSKH